MHSRILTTALLCAMACAFASASFAQSGKLLINENPKDDIRIPNILGYQTLVCDFHTHTVFSDGMVWPTIRAQEAWREGLDAIAITDHIEYQPHKDDLPTNHNRPYEMVKGVAAELNLLFPRGTEITRSTPPGHYNAIFINDVEPLATDDFLDVVKEANEQGGFVFWNHPIWQGIERGRWREVQDTMKANNWLHGIEVCNGGTYYPEAHHYAITYNLTMMGTSDIHQPALGLPRRPNRHRTVSLVFAKERALEAVKEALFAKRTVVWHNNNLIGDEEYLQAIFKESLKISKPHHQSKNRHWIEIQNVSELNIELLDSDGNKTVIPGKTTVQARFDAEDGEDEITAEYRVKNFWPGPDQTLNVSIKVPLK